MVGNIIYYLVVQLLALFHVLINDCLVMSVIAFLALVIALYSLCIATV